MGRPWRGIMSDRRRSFPQIDSRRPFRGDNRRLFLRQHTAVPPSQQQTIVSGRHNALLD
ncbi:hypothetical protein K443DRAFT_428387 [Laccaria amethystina LaAM-08-1]|uniref:Uncharacterized protein n=1 Tax=Laccaria amethystina LaAM-08-1 TaxID=1095629 RepID=A0A0C9WIB2_9AGAR|nr:hypothetical protein K443DRAFT_428387 [Laccaria amethystina LaAM-08-1]